MSDYKQVVIDIVKSIYNTPEEWEPVKTGFWNSIRNGDIAIQCKFMDSWSSWVDVWIGGANLDLTNKEKKYVKKAIKHYYANAKLDRFLDSLKG